VQLETSKFTTETPYNVQVTIEPIEKCVIFKDIFPRLSRTKVIIQDFPRGMGTLTTGVRRISRTLLNPSRWRKRVDCGRHSAETDYILPRLCTKCSERGLVCLMWVRLCGTACPTCPSPSAGHHLRQPSSDNLKHFYSLRIITFVSCDRSRPSPF